MQYCMQYCDHWFGGKLRVNMFYQCWAKKHRTNVGIFAFRPPWKLQSNIHLTRYHLPHKNLQKPMANGSFRCAVSGPGTALAMIITPIMVSNLWEFNTSPGGKSSAATTGFKEDQDTQAMPEESTSGLVRLPRKITVGTTKKDLKINKSQIGPCWKLAACHFVELPAWRTADRMRLGCSTYSKLL